MAVTPNFSWPTPDDTALVKDGAAAMRDLGDAIDATVYSTGGLVYITEATATSGSTLDITGCFSSTYDAYRIVISDWRTAAGASVTFRLLSGSTPATTQYAWAFARTDYTGASAPAASGYPAYVSSWASQSTSGSPAGDSAAITMEVLNPFLTQYTYYTINGQDSRGTSGYGVIVGGGTHYTEASYTGIRLTLSASTFSNVKVRVYGYRQA